MTNGPVNAHLTSEQTLSTKPGDKWLRDFWLQAFILISQPCSVKVKGTSYTFVCSLRLLHQPFSRPRAGIISTIVAFFSYNSLSWKIWPCHKTGHCHHRVIMWSKILWAMVPCAINQSSWKSNLWFQGTRFIRLFKTYGRGSHLVM